jgi:1-acyl-sn-glycerol-3-phosphate acyltransferase
LARRASRPRGRRRGRLARDFGSASPGRRHFAFPEGTRTKDGNLQHARSGIGLTVIKSNAPVIPVRVFGTFEAFNRFHKFPHPHRIAVKYGLPIDFSALREEAKVCSKPRLKEIYQEVADRIMAEIAALQPHTDKRRFPG